MVKKFMIVTLLCTLLFIMVGCAKLISSEEFVDTVTIVDVNYSPSWVQPMKVGKTTTSITHPASYDVKIAYGENNQFSTTVDDSNLYKKCKDKVGETLNAKFVKNTYEDGTIKIKFVELVE